MVRLSNYLALVRGMHCVARQARESPGCSFGAIDMRLAFVVRLGNDTRPAEGSFEGWVEEVDSSIEIRFRSAEDLLRFLGQRFDLAMASSHKDRASNKNDRVTPEKTCPVGKKSVQRKLAKPGR